MNRTHTGIASITAIVVAAWSGALPVGAAHAQTQGPQPAHQAQPGSLLVVPAADLINRPIKDTQGHAAGQVNSIVLDNENGAVDFVVIGGSDNFDLNGQVIAVPWSALVPPTSARGDIVIKVPADKLAQAPRLDQNALARLDEPGARARIYGAYGYGYPPPYAARYGYWRPGNGYGNGAPAAGAYGGGYGGNNGAPTGTPYGAYAGGGGTYYGPGYGPPAYAQGAPAAGDRGVGGYGNAGSYGGGIAPQQAGGGQQANAGASQNGGDQNESGANRMNGTQRQMVQQGLVVGPRGAVSELRSPTTQSASAMQSADVVARNGNTVGRIDQVLLDPEHGEVAFVLLERGGFLGLSPSWFALPVEALAWAPNGNGYRLTVNEQLLSSEPSIPVDENHLPTQVSLQDLAQLYQHFGITPYWEQGRQQIGQNASSSAPSSGSSQQR